MAAGVDDGDALRHAHLRSLRNGRLQQCRGTVISEFQGGDSVGHQTSREKAIDLPL